MSLRTLALLLILVQIPALIAQSDKVPTDITSGTMVFLLYDKFPIKPEYNKATVNRVNKLNELRKEANDEIREAAKEYPYPRKVMKRSDYLEQKDTLKADFVLDWALMEAANNGENLNAGMNTALVAPVHVKVLRTGEQYDLFDMSDSFVYQRVGDVIRKAIKKIEREAKKETE